MSLLPTSFLTKCLINAYRRSGTHDKNPQGDVWALIYKSARGDNVPLSKSSLKCHRTS
jgi:hypothetical protein